MHTDRHCYGVSNEDQIITSDELTAEMSIVHVMEARHATQQGDLTSLKRLLDAGFVTVDAVDADDCSLLHWAAINNRLEIAKLLIERKCNVNAVGGVLASTPLHWASRHGLGEMVALIVKNGANWNLKDVEGFTPLHIAVQFGCTPVAAFFIASGQSPDTLDDTQMTPAMWAAYKVHNVFPLKMLAMMGADLERHDATYGNTALHWAVIQANHTAVNTLLRLQVDPAPMNKEKETPLDIARRKNDLLTVRLLELRLRECGLAPSTWRQRLREDKNLSRNVLMIMPFLTTFCGAFILDSAMDYLSKAELLTLLAIFSTMTIRYFLHERRDPNIQHLLMGVALACKLFLIVGWFVFLQPIVPFFLQIAFLVLTVVVPCVFYHVYNSDPGFITSTHKERCEVVLEVTAAGNFDNFCSTCMVLKPHRTHHCRLCGKCVRMHDHHCPWLSTCVGASNHPLFVGYLFLLNLSTLLTFIACFYYWREVCGEVTRENVIFCRPWVLIMHWMSFTFFVWTSVMTCIQCYELLSRYLSTKLASRRCAQFNFGGGKLNMRSPFSRRCLFLRRICALGCMPTSADADEYDAPSTAFNAAPSSVRTIPRGASSPRSAAEKKERTPLL